jgi:hypothetical protein
MIPVWLAGSTGNTVRTGLFILWHLEAICAKQVKSIQLLIRREVCGLSHHSEVFHLKLNVVGKGFYHDWPDRSRYLP